MNHSDIKNAEALIEKVRAGGGPEATANALDALLALITNHRHRFDPPTQNATDYIGGVDSLYTDETEVD